MTQQTPIHRADTGSPPAPALPDAVLDFMQNTNAQVIACLYAVAACLNQPVRPDLAAHMVDEAIDIARVLDRALDAANRREAVPASAAGVVDKVEKKCQPFHDPLRCAIADGAEAVDRISATVAALGFVAEPWLTGPIGNQNRFQIRALSAVMDSLDRLTVEAETALERVHKVAVEAGAY